MKTINKSEYDALPEERRKYWKENSLNTILSGDIIINYTPIQINLEDAERVLEEARDKIIKRAEDNGNGAVSDFLMGRSLAYAVSVEFINQSLNNLKQLTK